MSTASKTPLGKLAARVAALIKRTTSRVVSPRAVETRWEEEDYTAGPVGQDAVPDPWDPVGETVGDTRPPRAKGTSELVPKTDTPPVAGGESPEIDEVPLSPDAHPTDVVYPDHSDTFERDTDVTDEVDVDGLDAVDIDPATWPDGQEDEPDDDTAPGVPESSPTFDDPELDLDGWDDLDDYDPDARQLPGIVPQTDTTRVAAGKAAHVVRLMPLPRRTDQEIALRYLTDLFEHLPHPATYRALCGLARNLDIEEIEAMVSLREVWLDCDEWTGGFSWRLAHRICRARAQYTPDTMVDDEWLSEWRLRESGHRWFSAWIDLRLQAQKALRLDEALRTHASHENPDDALESWRADRVVHGLVNRRK